MAPKEKKRHNLTFEGRFFDPFFGDFSKEKGTGSLGYGL
jgi:hypothetical protein